MLSIQHLGSTPTRLYRPNQTSLACAIARADVRRRHGALTQCDLPLA